MVSIILPHGTITAFCSCTELQACCNNSPQNHGFNFSSTFFSLLHSPSFDLIKMSLLSRLTFTETTNLYSRVDYILLQQLLLLHFPSSFLVFHFININSFVLQMILIFIDSFEPPANNAAQPVNKNEVATTKLTNIIVFHISPY